MSEEDQRDRTHAAERFAAAGLLEGVNLCRVNPGWTAAQLLARRAAENADAWADGDDLTFVCQSAADDMRLSGGIQLPLWRVPDSDLWALTVRVRNLARAIISYMFVSYVDEQPVVYAADGDAVAGLAALIEPLIADGSLPPVLLVGVHAASDPARDVRAEEYLPDHAPDRFAMHRRFFVEEVSAWAEAELGAARERSGRAVFGFSNGGVLAAALGLRCPDRYGHVIAFSLGMLPELDRWPAGDLPRHYLLAGTLEEGFCTATAHWARSLAEHGVACVHQEWVCGHDFTMWTEAFPAALAWAFAKGE